MTTATIAATKSNPRTATTTKAAAPAAAPRPSFLFTILATTVVAVLLLLDSSYSLQQQPQQVVGAIGAVFVDGLEVRRPAAAAAAAASAVVVSPYCHARSSATRACVDVAPARPPSKGLGAFATRPYQLGDYVGTYSGERMTHNQVRTRYWGKRALTTTTTTTMTGATTDADADGAAVDYAAAEDYSKDGGTTTMMNDDDQDDHHHDHDHDDDGDDDNNDAWIQSRIRRGQGMTGHYVLELNDGDFIDGEDTDMAGWERFMNHASDTTRECNVKLFDRLLASDVEALDIPQFYATRTIEPGEELCWDYGPNSVFCQEME